MDNLTLKAFASLSLVIVSLSCIYAQYTDESANYQSDRLIIGGGGYWTGMVFHPTVAGLAYVRSDVVSPYRRDPGEDTWDYTGDFFSPEYGEIRGSEGIAIGADPTVLYCLQGASLNIPGMGLYKTSDQGETWTQVLPTYADGNDDSRQKGEPVQVDPNTDEVIYVGTQTEGLFRSTTGGDAGSFVNIPDIPALDDDGTKCVAVDGSSTVNGRSAVVYASVHGQGVFRSTNGGDNFSLLVGSPATPTGMVVAAGSLFVADDAEGLWKFDGSSWTDISPVGQTTGFYRIDVDPNNADYVYAVQLSTSFFWRSSDGGASWSAVSFAEGTIVDATPDFDFFRSPVLSPAFVKVDPFTAEVFVGDAYGVWRCADPFAATTEWVLQYRGLNNTITIDLATPPKGNATGVVYTGSPDVEGFRFVDPTLPYTNKYSGLGPNAPGIDY